MGSVTLIIEFISVAVAIRWFASQCLQQTSHSLQGWKRYHFRQYRATEADYLVSMYPSPSHTIHPPHIGSMILGESVIIFWNLRIHFNNLVSLLHGIIQSSPEFDCSSEQSVQKFHY